MKRFLLALLLVVVGMAGLEAAAPDSLTGTWSFTVKSDRGERTRDIQLRQEGEKLFVTMKNMREEEVTSEGTFRNGEVEWVSVRQTPRGELRIAYRGKLEGQTLQGTAQFGDGPVMTWSAVRAPR